jgi:dTDP-4-amino-4,6-dideoxygalactose transaminase
MKKIFYRRLEADNNRKKLLQDEFKKFLYSGNYLPGKMLRKFEQSIAKKVGKKYCIGVSSGTTAIYLSLIALGIKKNDEIICPAISWIATANAIKMTGATPIFADVERNRNISIESVKKLITSRTKAILTVHFTGLLSPINELKKLAKSKNIFLVEDTAQAFGTFQKKKMAGSFSDISTFSFNPMKVLQGYGEAGAVLTNSKNISTKLKKLRDLGLQTNNREICDFISLNYKMDELHAYFLLINLKYYKDDIKKRKKLIKSYQKHLNGIVKNCEYNLKVSNGYDYQILVNNRDKLMRYLQKKGIETRLKHPLLMSEQPIYKKQKKLRRLPNAEYIARHSISLPLHNYLKDQNISFISKCIKNFYKHEKKR